tara:strand:+ start:1267 stop:1572 length:306 start_codon:yes stop_codon:yes gene_type:complete
MADGDIINLNTCRSYKVTVTTALVQFTDMTCSEVLVYNKSGQDLELYDQNYSAAANAFLIADGESVTLRGLTNADQLSGKLASGSGTVYYRTQRFSNNPSR